MTKTKTQPKYTIGDHLKSAPGNYTKNQYKMALALDITIRTLEKYIKLPKDSHKSMSSDLYFQMVAYLKINQNQLLNQ